MGTWKVDAPRSWIGFSARHFLVNRVHGRFTSVRGTVVVADSPGECGASGTIDAASIETGDEVRDKHLRSANFLDAERWPLLHFQSTAVELTQAGYSVTGDLTIRELTHPVKLHVHDLSVVKDSRQALISQGEHSCPTGTPGASTVLRCEASGKINRHDFGLTWAPSIETGGIVVSDEIQLHLTVVARRAHG